MSIRAGLPEAPGLCRGARVTAWILAVAALSCGLAWAGLQAVVQILHFAVLGIAAAVCYGLYRAHPPRDGTPPAFPLDLTILSVLGARTNLLASVLDTAEAQLGIDLRSTWALTVVRRSLEPIVIGLCSVGLAFHVPDGGGGGGAGSGRASGCAGWRRAAPAGAAFALAVACGSCVSHPSAAACKP